MSNVDESKKASQMPLMGTRMIVAALLCFAGCCLYMPSADVFRTIPFVALFAALADVVYKNIKYNVGFAAVFSFSLLCLNGFSMAYASFFAFCGAVFAVSAIYGVRLLGASSKTAKKELKKRCRIRAVAVLALSFALYMLVCGNVISFLMKKSGNIAYINEHYKELVKVTYTDFDAKTREYKTHITFTHEGIVVGKSDDCFVSENNDGRRNYLEDVIMENCNKYLKLYVSEAVDMFEITNSGIYFEKDEVISDNADMSAFENDTWYVISLYHTVDTQEGFLDLCNKCFESFRKNPQFTFRETIICGGNASEVLFMCTINGENIKKDALTVEDVKTFDAEYVKKYGVTEKTYLDYWQNK